MVVKKTVGFAGQLGTMIVSSALLVILGLIYFMVSLWIIKTGSAMLGYMVEGNWAVLSATILSVGGLIGRTDR